MGFIECATSQAVHERTKPLMVFPVTSPDGDASKDGTHPAHVCSNLQPQHHNENQHMQQPAAVCYRSFLKYLGVASTHTLTPRTSIVLAGKEITIGNTMADERGWQAANWQNRRCMIVSHCRRRLGSLKRCKMVGLRLTTSKLIGPSCLPKEGCLLQGAEGNRASR